MNKLFIILPLITISLFGFTQVYSLNGNNNDWNNNNHDNETNGLKEKLDALTLKVEELESQVFEVNQERINDLEFKTLPKLVGTFLDENLIIINSINPPIPECDYINVGTEEEPVLEVYGWCPESSDVTYWIPDVNATDGSIVLTNIQRQTEFHFEATPNCKSTFSGTKQMATTNFTGFIVECISGNPYPDFRDILAYTIFPAQ